MNTRLKVSLSEHASRRIRERSALSPGAVLEFINNGAVHEAHRENGVSYLVLWGEQDKRPYLVIVENGTVISFYYTYEFHRRKNNCVILPVHIRMAKKALHDLFALQKIPKYHVMMSWEESLRIGHKRFHTKKLFTCSKFEFESFQGVFLEFVGSKTEAFAALSQISIQKGGTATIFIKRSDNTVIASEELCSD